MNARASALAIALATLALHTASAAAQTLVDPTLPPPESRLTSSNMSDAPSTGLGPQLQSVLIGSHGRQVAVIDGQTVQLGQKFKGSVLVKVSRNQVVLQNGRQKQVLTLFPDTGADAKKSAH